MAYFVKKGTYLKWSATDYEEEAGDKMETGRCRQSKENLSIFSI